MKLKIRYENEHQIIVLNDMDAESLWISLSVEGDETTQEEKERLIQKAFDHQMNNPERRSWRTYNTHIGDVALVGKDGTTKHNTEEGMYRHAINKDRYTHDMDAAEVSNSYADWRAKIREAFPKETAEMLIAIALDGMMVEEYAVKIGDKPNNVSHRYRRAIKKFQKIFPKNVLLDHP